MRILELQAITERSVLMYPVRAALARLVLPTFAARSDVSVVIKHEMQFVLGWLYLTGIRGLIICSWSHETIICSWSYCFG